LNPELGMINNENLILIVKEGKWWVATIRINF
jgi:hypothetical protein